MVVAFGDSVPAGNACDCVPFPELYAQRRPGPARALNLGMDGYTSADLLDEVREADLGDAVTVLIMVGANDAADAFPGAGAAGYARIAARTEANVAEAVRAIHAATGDGLPVFVIGYWNVVQDGDAAAYGPGEDEEAAVATEDVNRALAEAAAQTGATFVPTYPLFKGVDGRADPTGLLAEDGDHPNEAGHQVIAAAIPVPGTGPAQG
ncbi:SGNH/GDSL hydrolase family protein [Catenuloplanes japonicus]|uniref:SGNH/GDSL hydrolase family protein n=1 Tax=Catenuloplanes japonicus TaxID=33876 RepID=UPI000ADF9F2F|nr:SGNH/GDSL hydrolase family protein [Catenuloplanes japonicus]